MIHVPTIMPDEWLNGYLERLKFLNGYRSQKNITELLQQELKLEKTVSMVEILAALLNQSTENIVWQHTLIPAIRAITDNNPSVRHGDTSKANHLRMLGTRKMVHHPRYCPKCVKEDVGYRGFAYFRRSHQITGIDWCLKHQIKLKNIEESAIPTPISLMQKANSEILSSSFIEQSPAIERYVHIFDGLVSNQFPVSAEHASWVLSEQAIKLGLNRSPNKQGTTLSDIAIVEIPHQWLLDNFPVLKNKQTHQFIPSIDGVTIFRFQNHTVPNFVLGAALLFGNADEALNKLIHLKQVHKKPVRKLIKRPTDFWRSDELVGLYIKHRGSCSDITEEIGGSYDQNRINLTKNGLPPLSILSNETIQAISDFYAGAFILDVLRRPSVNSIQLEYIIRNTGNTFGSIFNRIKSSLLENNALKVKKITLRNVPVISAKQNLSTQNFELEDMTSY